MTKYTPAPWSVYPGQNPGIEGDGGKKSVVVFGDVAGDEECGVLGKTPEQQQANAKLIAAAPDMLAVLHRVVAVYDAHFTPGEGLIEELRQVIAQATGE